MLVPHPVRYPHLRPIRKSPSRTADFIISASCQVELYVTGSRVQRIVSRPEYIVDEHCRYGQIDAEYKFHVHIITHINEIGLSCNTYLSRLYFLYKLMTRRF